MWFKKRKKVLMICLVLGVAVNGLFGQDSVLRDQIKLKDSVYYYKDKSDHIDIPTPTPTYYKDSAKCPNDPITYLNNNMMPFNGIVFNALQRLVQKCCFTKIAKMWEMR
jgi:hypothetical protein